MKYKDFIKEATDHGITDGAEAYKKQIDINEAVKLINTHCKKINYKKPLYRGMKKSGDFLLMEGQKGGRKSETTSNHYTLIIDELLRRHYKTAPLRSKSIICANDELYTSIYGETYVVLPYDDVVIGKTGTSDIWGSKADFAGVNKGLSIMNDRLKKYIEEPKTYDEIVNAIVRDLQSDDPIEMSKDLIRIWRKIKKIPEDKEITNFKEMVEESLRIGYEPSDQLDMEFGTYSELGIGEVRYNYEYWFGGKAVVILKSEYDQMLKDGLIGKE